MGQIVELRPRTLAVQSWAYLSYSYCLMLKTDFVLYCHVGPFGWVGGGGGGGEESSLGTFWVTHF